jgi:hypothetical protein
LIYGHFLPLQEMQYFAVWPTSTLKLLRFSRDRLTVSASCPHRAAFSVLFLKGEQVTEDRGTQFADRRLEAVS